MMYLYPLQLFQPFKVVLFVLHTIIMVIKFYHFGFSPPSRSVEMTLKALGLEYETTIVDLLQEEQKKPEFLAINPRGRVPALIDGDLKLSESRAIAAYLCNQYAKGEKQSLYPADPDKRAVVDMCLYITEWVLDQILEYMNLREIFSRGGKPRDEKLDETKNALKFLDDRLEKQKYLAGNTLTVADFFGYPTVLFLDAVKFSAFGDYPNVVLWMGRMKALPYNEAVNGKAMRDITAGIQEALKPTE